MKKTIILALCAILLAATSCRKDSIVDTVVINNTVKHTDEPPAALFDSYTPYGTISKFLIDSAALRSAVVAYGYQYWPDQNNTFSYGNNGDWRRISVYVYWGRLDNVDYLSTGKSIVWMTPEAMLKAIDIVNRKKIAYGGYCSSCTAFIDSKGVVGFITWAE